MQSNYLKTDSQKDTTLTKTSPDRPSPRAHKLELDRDHSLSMTGVKDVPTFTDKNVTVKLDKDTLLISGQNLLVKSLDVESGKLLISGQVTSLKYTSTATPTSFLKRLFK